MRIPPFFLAFLLRCAKYPIVHDFLVRRKWLNEPSLTLGKFLDEKPPVALPSPTVLESLFMQVNASLETEDSFLGWPTIATYRVQLFEDTHVTLIVDANTRTVRLELRQEPGSPLHHPEKPALLIWHQNPDLHNNFQLIEMGWYNKGVLHRSGDEPALLTRGFEELCLEFEIRTFYKNGKIHRDDDKPAKLVRSYDFSYGKTKMKRQWEWYIDGRQRRHDEQLPALITLNPAGRVLVQEWYNEHGRWKRLDYFPERSDQPGKTLVMEGFHITAATEHFRAAYHADDPRYDVAEIIGKDDETLFSGILR